MFSSLSRVYFLCYIVPIFVLSSYSEAQESESTDNSQSLFECPDVFEGFYPHHIRCDAYWECNNGNAQLKLCGNGLGFDDTDPTFSIRSCNEIYNVNCGSRVEIEPAISTKECPRLYGTFAVPSDCSAFVKCRNGTAFKYNCPPGLAFDDGDRICKWADQVSSCTNTEIDQEETLGFICPQAKIGIFTKHPHPEDCRKYYVCVSNVAREYGCPLGSVYQIGSTDYDGKCADPLDVPECSGYYGDLKFDKNELVRAGADPEAVGASIVPRIKVNRPTTTSVSSVVHQAATNLITTTAKVISPSPISNSVNRVRQPPQRTRLRTVSPSSSRLTSSTARPPVRSTSIAANTRPVDLPSVALSSLPNTGNAGSKLPAKVKAGEDYYYYYYYYDDDEDVVEGGTKDNNIAAPKSLEGFPSSSASPISSSIVK